jgi:hypothetical protein
MDVMGGVRLVDGTQLSVVTGIDDHSRFCVIAKVVARATARPVCDALLEGMSRHGESEQILTDNGKVFTGKLAPKPATVAFDRICLGNGIRHILTAPYSPTTTGKIERLHKNDAQGSLLGTGLHHDRGDSRSTRCMGRPLQPGPGAPGDRRRPSDQTVRAGGHEPHRRRRSDAEAAQAAQGRRGAPTASAHRRAQGRPGWADQHPQAPLPRGAPPGGTVRHRLLRRRAPPGEPPRVLVATHVRRHLAEDDDRMDRGSKASMPGRPTTGEEVLRKVDPAGSMSFAGTTYRVGNRYA